MKFLRALVVTLSYAAIGAATPLITGVLIALWRGQEAGNLSAGAICVLIAAGAAVGASLALIRLIKH